MAGALERWPIVGRHDDLEAFERALAGDRTGFVVHGPAGVGKTRLAEQCRAAAEARGHAIAAVVASRTAAQLPLGALAHLIPPAPPGGRAFDPDELFERVQAHLRGGLDGRRLVLSIDDVHLLDVASATLVAQLLEAEGAFLLGTVREGEPAPAAVAALWERPTTVRAELGHLGRDDVATVLHLALGGPVTEAVTDHLWRSSGGNALFLRELVLEALGTGALAEEDGEWRAAELPTGSRRLVELVADRIGALDDGARAVLELLALCEPVGRPDLLLEISAADGDPDVGPAAVEAALAELELAGLVQQVEDRRRHEVILAHPLYAEALRAALPKLRARRILRRHIERIEAHGARRRTDPLRIATWRLDADGQADPGLLIQGALVARHAHDFVQTARLARAAYRADGSVQAGVLLGEAQYELGEFDEADEVLTAIDRPDLTEEEVLQVTSMRNKNLTWGHTDPEGALAVLRAARSRVSTEAAQELQAEEGSVRVFSGDPLGALERLASLGDVAEPRVRVLRAISEAPALSIVGRTGEAVRVAEQGYAEQLALDEPLAIAHPGTHVIAMVFALADAGRFAEADALGTAGLEGATADQVPIARIWFALNLGRVTLLRGRPAQAQRLYQQGVALARRHHFRGPLRLGLSGLAVCCALLGDAAGATTALAEQDALPAFGFLFPDQQLGRAWATQLGGDPAAARAVLLESAELAEGSGHLTSASWLLHEAVRLGATGLAPRLAALAEGSDSALLAARAEHAAALAAGDGARLDALVERWAELDAALEAAEAAIAAAEAHRRAGNQRAAGASDRRADQLAELTEGARTPGLTRSSTVVPLSRREREVALLAAQGIASKEISDRLDLSIRTVNNHLQRAYTKLDVTSRAELARALGLT